MISRRALSAVIGILCIACLAGIVSATNLATDWTEPNLLDNSPFAGVSFSSDGGTVFATGNQLLLRGWNAKPRFAGRPGFAAAMSADGNYVVAAEGKVLSLYSSKGEPLWDRNMPANVKAVAISRDGNLIICADETGYYTSWARNGDFYGRVNEAIPKRIAISRNADFVVATTEGGLRFFDAGMNLKWADNKSGSLETYICIPADGSAVITSGGTRLSSHTPAGAIKWTKDAITRDAILDMACAEDGSAIILGSQDNLVTAVDQYGIAHWTYATGNNWPHAVGVSRDASVIAVGANDGNLYVLDHGGSLLAKRDLHAIIQPRALAVSRDGTRITVADQYRLNGISVLGDTVPEGMVTYTSTPLNPVARLTTEPTATPRRTVSPVLTLPLTTEAMPQTTLPETQKSPVPIWAGVTALGIAAAIAQGGWHRRF